MKKFEFKHFLAIKFVLYMIAGILVLVFNKAIMEYVGVVVGSVVIVFGLDMSIVTFVKRNYSNYYAPIFEGLTQILLGVILILVRADIVKVCLVWAVWSIIREGKEMSEAVHHIIKKRRGFINLAESVALIFFSFQMILHPTEHHAHTHVYLLGVELMLEVLFPYANILLDRLDEKRKRSSDAEVCAESENAEADPSPDSVTGGGETSEIESDQTASEANGSEAD